MGTTDRNHLVGHYRVQAHPYANGRFLRKLGFTYKKIPLIHQRIQRNQHPALLS